MKVTWEVLTIEVGDPSASARWWAETVGWDVVSESSAGVEVRSPDGTGTGLFFVLTAEPKAEKNRLHLDLYAEDQGATAQRLVERGAERVDVGQSPDAEWIVLRDPDGHEFCLLEPRND
ncbi:hypothetical protein AD006_12250 [Pseudonocardia sp. EC080610-09]|uniref:VOC family protein n=1 Tax=unclassified Pseudonocardia TaxID=2619320 RepID=UPI0006CB62B6|nr:MULTISPECIES: VOC family protein [unclassified Pseudonocardia]ALE72569.1 hypothetical protein FRP1_04590 [Pseudonocardia sp. EC080625-04]ALL75884.1 hypothetical protein AD006_12250 [Pseudonocardia sp. EC080610-09]ALL82911.1 hypothetical protein AD017_20075 [Pseudonocardia sp. EC080619-01]